MASTYTQTRRVSSLEFINKSLYQNNKYHEKESSPKLVESCLFPVIISPPHGVTYMLKTNTL